MFNTRSILSASLKHAATWHRMTSGISMQTSCIKKYFVKGPGSGG